MRRDDDERRPDGDGGPVGGGDPFSLAGLVVPDDARELDADFRALHRERRAQARRERLRRLLLTRRWRRYGISGPIVVGVLLLVAAFASLMLLFQPRRPAARPVPLATGLRATGQEGGLLPDVAVRRADGQTVPLRDYRPAVVMLEPRFCDNCDSLVHTYGQAALRHHLSFVLVGADLPAAPADLTDASVVRASEPTGQLARIYQLARRPVALLVRSDGVVNRQLSQEPTASGLDGELAFLVATGSGGTP
jgi:hypothetical protein